MPEATSTHAGDRPPPPPSPHFNFGLTKVNDRKGQLDTAGFIIARAGVCALIRGAGVKA